DEPRAEARLRRRLRGRGGQLDGDAGDCSRLPSPTAPLEARLHPRVDLHAYLRVALQEAALSPDPRVGPDGTVPLVRPADRARRNRGGAARSLPGGDPPELDPAALDPLHPRSAPGA